MPDFIPFVVGLAAVALFLLSYQMKSRGGIIIVNAVSRALYVLQYLLLGAFEGAVLDILGIIASVAAKKSDSSFLKKYKKLLFVLVDLSIVAVGLLLYENIFSLFPIAGVLLHTSAFWMTDEKKIRFVSFFGSPFWLVYNLYSGAYGSVIGDALTMLSICIAVFRYDIRPRLTSKNK